MTWRDIRMSEVIKNDFEILFTASCRLHTNFMIGRYLMSNADGRWDGAEKAQRHIELCEFYLNCFGIDKIDEYEAFEAVHDATQELTDNLDTMIGFPLKGRPNYDELEPKFFDIFHKIAIQTLFDYLKDEPKVEQ
jgi:hypothetical protein